MGSPRSRSASPRCRGGNAPERSPRLGEARRGRPRAAQHRPGGRGAPGASRSPAARWIRRTPARRGWPSLAFELRLALLQEGLHPLDPVLGRHRQLVEATLVLEAGGEGGLLGYENGLLG